MSARAAQRKYRSPKIKRTEVLGFFGDDKAAARAEMFRLAEVLEKTGATWKMGVKTERRQVGYMRPEWVIVLIHYDIER